MTDQEKAIAAATAAATAETDAAWRSEVLDAQVYALAVGKVVDPDLMSTLINRDAIGWDGRRADRSTIEAEIARVLAAKPYLASPKAPAPTGSADQGSRTPNGQMAVTAEQLKAMTPQQVAALMRSNPAAVTRALSGT